MNLDAQITSKLYNKFVENMVLLQNKKYLWSFSKKIYTLFYLKHIKQIIRYKLIKYIYIFILVAQ